MRMTECLHCQINELVRARLEHDHPIDLNDLVAKIVECAAELIADIAPAEEQAKAVADGDALGPGRCARDGPHSDLG
jgi:hypothetical protein